MQFLPTEIITQKRDGKALSDAMIEDWIKGIAKEEVSDAQIAAFTMAVFLRGMTKEETTCMTLSMRNSGHVMDWNSYGLGDAPIVDKHSTGGVGDKTSFLIAPILAACGCYNPMVSGRGLGHTGGTLDKLEAIDNFKVDFTKEEFAKQVKDHKLAIVSAGSDIATADRRIYAVRDVTATTACLPLITSSILSKKMAAGLKGLVMDVKTGHGAFLPKMEDSRKLAQTIVEVAKHAGLPCHALITDMNANLGWHAGNSLEMIEIADWFNKPESREPRLTEITIALCAHGLLTVGMAKNEQEATAMVQKVIDNGSAAEYFEHLIALQSGHANFLKDYAKLMPEAPICVDLFADHEGIITMQDSRALGIAIIMLGGGRKTSGQKLDHAVGLANVKTIGEHVDAQTPLMQIHARTQEDALAVQQMIKDAFTIAPKGTALKAAPSVIEIIK